MNVPITCHPDFFPPEYSNKSYAEAVSGTTPLISDEMHKIWALYAAPSGICSGANPEISTLLADLKNFPRSRIYVAGQDPVRDEAVAFAEKLEATGMEVKLAMYRGVPRVFTMFDDLVETKQFWKDARVSIKELLDC